MDFPFKLHIPFKKIYFCMGIFFSFMLDYLKYFIIKANTDTGKLYANFYSWQYNKHKPKISSKKVCGRYEILDFFFLSVITAEFVYQ
jgi:hypothetical protein